MSELRENKVYMMRHFQDIEDEINQAVNSLKALLIQNTDVSEHAEICLKKARGFELKLISESKANNEQKQINENLSKEIFELKNTLEENNSLNVFLNEKIMFYENKLQQKDKEILDIKAENDRRDEQIKRLFKEIEILNVELDAKNFNAEEEINKEAEKELDIDNLKGILSERENKKKLINEKIKEHINDSKSIKRTKSGKSFLKFINEF
jgi:chromosome segregation ATPase